MEAVSSSTSVDDNSTSSTVVWLPSQEPSSSGMSTGKPSPPRVSLSPDKATTANEHSQTAAQLLQASQYWQAVEEYQKAGNEYLLNSNDKLAVCNAAACWRNVGLIYQQLLAVEASIQAWQQAETLYQQAAEWTSEATEEDTTPLQDDDDSIESFCIDGQWLETLQGRAALHWQQEDWIPAVQCHEQVLKRLLELENQSNQEPTVQEGVLFQPLRPQQQVQLLIVSLTSLGTLYRQTRPENGMAVFEQALQILRQRYQEQGQQDDKFLESLTLILRSLSDLYFEQGLVDKAVDALHDVMDIKLCSTRHEPSLEAIQAMDKMGQANEQMQLYDKALACYEKALLAKSRCWGNEHVDVARSLIHIARVMELQGNSEGSMDLYRAAHAIYANQVTAQSFQVEDDDAQAILQLVPAILEQGRFQEAIAYLQKCLQVADKKSDSVVLDKSLIYYDLGRAYMGIQDYVSATVCLVEAAKEGGGDVEEQDVMALLQRVEYLQRNKSPSHQQQQEEEESEADTKPVHSATGDGRERIDTPVNAAENALAQPVSPTGEISSRESRSVQPKGTSTPVTLEGLSASEDKSENLSKRDDPQNGSLESDDEGSTAFNDSESSDGDDGDDEEATAFYDSEPEAGIARIPRSDVSSSGDEHQSLTDSPAITIDPVPREPDDPDLNNISSLVVPNIMVRVHSPASGEETKGSSVSPQRHRRSSSFADKFRRKRKDGFESLPEEKVVVKQVLPSEDDYHSTTTFDGPIQFVSVESVESSMSQITLRFEDPNKSRENSQEWWWGVTSKGVSRWFPSAYVSQAVEAAEGFLSAKSIHAQKKIEHSPLSLLSDDDEDEETADEQESCEEADHPSHVGIATSKATRERKRGMHRNANHENERQKSSPHHDSLFSSPSPRRPSSANFSSEIAECEERLLREQNLLGKNHPDVATTLFTLAVFHSRGEQSIDAAVESATEALRIQKMNGSMEDAIRSLHFLADLNLHQKKFSSALTYYAEALKLESARHGYYSDETARTLNCIGAARSLENEFALAMESHQEALHILKERHGDDLKHPLVSDTLCQIGSVYYRERNSLSSNKSQNDAYSTFIEGGMLEVIGRAHEDRGSYKMAISFFEEKLQFLENRGKSNDVLEETATTLNSLGMLCSRAGLYVEAIDYYEKALSIQLQLGCDEIDVATARILTAAAQFQLGKWHESLTMLQDALQVLHRELGEEHETAAAALFHIGVVQAALCQYELAMESFKQALKLQDELLGEDHPATLRTHREIGKMYTIYETELNTAFEIHNDVLDTQKEIHGEEHPNIAETLHCIGCAYSRRGDYYNALRVLEECYYMRLKFLGWDHPLQATTLHEIANIHLSRGRLKKANHICDVILRIRTEGLSDKHIDVGRTLVTKGSCLVAKGNLDGAAQCFALAQAMCEETVGARHPLVGDVHAEKGLLWLRKCQFDEARKEIEVALEIYRESGLDEDHPSIKKALQKLERVERDEMLCV